MNPRPIATGRSIALVALLASGLVGLAPLAQSSDREQGARSPAAAQARVATRKASPYQPPGLPPSARDYYTSTWGVDRLQVQETASDNLIRFSYRVTKAAQAAALNDKRATPYLVGHRSHAILQVPVMAKVGQLRQTGAPESGKEYWMVFSNKGNLVKRGDRVSVVVGSFHADGLVVE